MKHIGDNLSWIGSLIGDMPRKEVALRNLCRILAYLTLPILTLRGANIVTLISVGDCLQTYKYGCA